MLERILLLFVSISLCTARVSQRLMRTQRRQGHVSNANQLDDDLNLFDYDYYSDRYNDFADRRYHDSAHYSAQRDYADYQEYSGYDDHNDYNDFNDYGDYDEYNDYDEYAMADDEGYNDEYAGYHGYGDYDGYAEWEGDDEDYDQMDSDDNKVVISKEGPPPAPQEYTISKLEEPVVCEHDGAKTWKRWKKYDLDGICSRLQYYGEIEGQCETDCDALCPEGFYEVAKEPCTGVSHLTMHSEGGAHTVTHTVHSQSGYYRQCVGRYQCTHSQYNYWVNMKWWQFLLWEVAIVIIGCCFCGLAVGCCIRCFHRGTTSVRRPNPSQNRNRGRQNPQNGAA